MKKIFLDVECYPNYFLICFKSADKSRFYQLTDKESLNLKEISQIMNKYLTVGFNSKNYDLPMIAYALKGATNKQLKELSDAIITSKEPSWVICKEFGIFIPLEWNHIDLIEPAPAVKIGLKMYGARMHTHTLQDLPLEPDTIVVSSQHSLLRKYCFNDIDITINLFNEIRDRLELREKIGKIYNLELRSKSDAQVAETIIKKLLGVKSFIHPIDINKEYFYNPPSFIEFYTPDLINFFDSLKKTGFKCEEKGNFNRNKDLPSKVKIKNNNFSVGVGGLHSNEKHTATLIDSDEEFLLDIDVVSYYPSIILNNNYYPEHLGENFLNIYRNFYTERIKAKQTNNKIKADTYKIILNGSFGKFGSRFSTLYSPSLLLHTTLTGQLALLMLIERVILKDFEVISANTDGITIRGKKSRLPQLDLILDCWEKLTNFKLEKTSYKALYHESVNSYVALLEDNKIKCKGLYAFEGLAKNPVCTICIEAIIEYLKNNILPETTIMQNKDDIKKFLIIRKVEGGAMFKDQYLGKVVRWYYSTNGDKITYKKNGNKVAGSDGAVPLMVLDNKPINDIDFQKYIAKSKEMLKNLGVNA